MQGLNVLLVGGARPRPVCWDGAAAECVVLSQGLDLLVGTAQPLNVLFVARLRPVSQPPNARPRPAR